MATPRTKKTSAVTTAEPTATKAATKAAPKPKAAKAVPGPKLVVAPETLVAAASPTTPDPETTTTTAAEVPTMRKKDLIDRVVTATSAKRRDVKLIVEAALTVLGDALSKGEELHLPPFGKAKVNRQRDLGNGEMMIVKVRRNNGMTATSDDSKEALADDEE